MRVIDADGHVEENPITFSDKYFDPAFRAHRPKWWFRELRKG